MMKHSCIGWKTAAFALAMGLGVAGNATAQVRPAFVRDVDRSTAQPVSGFCNAYAPWEYPGLAKCELYTVPAGKRLVVETVSFRLVILTGQDVREVVFGKNNTQSPRLEFGPGSYAVSPGTPTADNILFEKLYSGSQALRFYLEEGEGLAGQDVYTGASVMSYPQSFGFSGYLVDK
jgi:hypothetical protein